MFRVIMKSKLIICDSYFVLAFDVILQRTSNLGYIYSFWKIYTGYHCPFSLGKWKLYMTFSDKGDNA